MACMYIQIIHFHFNNKKQQNRISCPKYHTIRSYTPRFDYYDQEQYQFCNNVRRKSARRQEFPGGISSTRTASRAPRGVRCYCVRSPGVFCAKSCNKEISRHFILTFGKTCFSRISYLQYIVLRPERYMTTECICVEENVCIGDIRLPF